MKTKALLSCKPLTRGSTGALQKNFRPVFSEHFLRNIVEEVMTLTEARTKHNGTTVRFNCESNPTILCDEAEIEQVLVNLINNGVDAVKTRDEKWIQLSIHENQDSVILRVIDSGFGIPENIRQKLFDPFFTTKQVGEGVGLGLSISKGILDEHKATLNVGTHDQHTCFEICFPKAGGNQNAA